jgi:hypothetical protein
MLLPEISLSMMRKEMKSPELSQHTVPFLDGSRLALTVMQSPTPHEFL